MKEIPAKALIALTILAFISCASNKSVHLLNLSAKELPSETEIVLTTTDPVQYKDTKLENPPCLIINFPENRVFSSEKDEMIINKGAVKKIKNEYYQNGPKGQRLLSFVIVELAQDLPYKISTSGSSIIIRIENPKESEGTAHKEKIKIEAEAQIRDKNLPIESGYLIGPGDVLSIEVWNQPDMSRDMIVNDKGEIRLPPIKAMSVMGSTTYQLEDKLVKALSKYLIDPIVFVTVKEYNSQRVIALGEIQTGMYTLKRKTSLVEFLGQIGGPTDNADFSKIKLIKKDGEIFSYNLNELISDPKKSDEVLVSGGDIIYVPPLEIHRVSVLGEVKSPKIINIKEKFSLVEAITEAGGYTENAVTSSVIIVRGELGALKGYRIDLNRILKKGDIRLNIELKPGDIVYVPKTFIADVERFLRDIALPLTWYFWYLK